MTLKKEKLVNKEKQNPDGSWTIDLPCSRKIRKELLEFAYLDQTITLEDLKYQVKYKKMSFDNALLSAYILKTIEVGIKKVEQDEEIKTIVKRIDKTNKRKKTLSSLWTKLCRMGGVN